VVRRLVIAAAALVGAGCGGGAPTGFGVNVTVESSAVALRGSIARAALRVSGDQPDPYTTDVAITSPLHNGEAHFRYVPSVTSGKLALHLDAFDATGLLLASGDSGSVTLVAGQAVPALIDLGAPNPITDMSMPDLAGGDLATADLLTPDLSTFDLSMADMAVQHDLAPIFDLTPLRGCHGYAACYATCLDQSCVTACQQQATANATTLFAAAMNCALNYCVSTGDAGGAGECVLDSMNQPIDPPGRPANTCSNCLSDVTAQMFGGGCPTPTSADCNNAQCQAPVSACVNDLP
jgi:hypothetical protein